MESPAWEPMARQAWLESSAVVPETTRDQAAATPRSWIELRSQSGKGLRPIRRNGGSKPFRNRDRTREMGLLVFPW